MSDKKPMKFKLGSKVVDNTTGKTSIAIKMNCSAEFMIKSLAAMLIDQEQLLEVFKESVEVAEMAAMFRDPKKAIDPLVSGKSMMDSSDKMEQLVGLNTLIDLVKDLKTQ